MSVTFMTQLLYTSRRKQTVKINKGTSYFTWISVDNFFHNVIYTFELNYSDSAESENVFNLAIYLNIW